MTKVNIHIHRNDIIENVVELKKSVTEAKGACSKTVKTSKNLEKKTKKGIYVLTC